MIPANYSTISFPSLGIEVNPGRTLALGPLTIHYYGLIIAIGLMLAVVYACRRCSQFGIKQDDLLDGVLWVTPFAILCARAYYCIFSWADYAENPISVLYIWNGGLAIYGGVLGAVAGILLLCRIKKIKIGALLDMVALGFLIGQSIGRWGNFVNREAFGAVSFGAYFIDDGVYCIAYVFGMECRTFQYLFPFGTFRIMYDVHKRFEVKCLLKIMMRKIKIYECPHLAD